MGGITGVIIQTVSTGTANIHGADGPRGPSLYFECTTCCKEVTSKGKFFAQKSQSDHYIYCQQFCVDCKPNPDPGYEEITVKTRLFEQLSRQFGANLVRFNSVLTREEVLSTIGELLDQLAVYQIMDQ